METKTMIDDEDNLTMSMFPTKTDLTIEALNRIVKYLLSEGEFTKAIRAVEAISLIQSLTCEVSSLKAEARDMLKLP